jgi:hypothetical protein
LVFGREGRASVWGYSAQAGRLIKTPAATGDVKSIVRKRREK